MAKISEGGSRYDDYYHPLAHPSKKGVSIMAQGCKGCKSTGESVGLYCSSSLSRIHITGLIKGKNDDLNTPMKGFFTNALKGVFCTNPKHHKWKLKWGFGKTKHQQILNPLYSFSKDKTRATKSLNEYQGENSNNGKRVFSKEGIKVKKKSTKSRGDQDEHEERVISRKGSRKKKSTKETSTKYEWKKNEHKRLVLKEGMGVNKTLEKYEGDQNDVEKGLVTDQQHEAPSVAGASAEAEFSAAVAFAAAEIAWLGGSLEERVATKIQSLYRGHLVRRCFFSPKGLMRLQALVHGQYVRRQAENTLHYMQVLVRIHSQIHSRKTHMAKQNQARQHHLQQKHSELENKRSNNESDHHEEWDNSLLTKEEQKARLQSKEEGSVKRERTLAYAFSHQLSRNTLKPVQSMLMEIGPNKPPWGWSWLEHWMAARPWDSYRTSEKAYSRMKLKYVGQSGQQTLPTVMKKPNSEPANCATTSKPFMFKINQSGLKKLNSDWFNGDTTSRLFMPNMERPSELAHESTSSRHSLASNMSSIIVRSDRAKYSSCYSISSSIMKDNESALTSVQIPNFMASTESTKAKARSQSNPKQRLHFPSVDTNSVSDNSIESSVPLHRTATT